MADADEIVRREEKTNHDPSTQEEWAPTGRTIAIIAIITGIIAIISDFIQ